MLLLSSTLSVLPHLCLQSANSQLWKHECKYLQKTQVLVTPGFSVVRITAQRLQGQTVHLIFKPRFRIVREWNGKKKRVYVIKTWRFKMKLVSLFILILNAWSFLSLAVMGLAILSSPKRTPKITQISPVILTFWRDKNNWVFTFTLLLKCSLFVCFVFVLIFRRKWHRNSDSTSEKFGN